MRRSASAALLNAVDPLPYPRRMARLGERARGLPAAELDRILAELAGGDRYRRGVALFLAVAAQRWDLVVAAVADPDPDLAATARAHWLKRAERADDIGAFLRDAPLDTRIAVYRCLRAARRADLADALVDEVRSRFGDTEAARLLVACGVGTVRRLLPELWHEVAGSRSLAHRHPGELLAEAGRQLAALSRPRVEQWWRRYGHIVLAARLAEPDTVLDLLERYGPTGWLPGDLADYGALGHPTRLVRLLTTAVRARWLLGARLPRALLSRLAPLPPAELAPLARRLRDSEAGLAALLKAVPPRHRDELFELAHTGVDRTLARTGDDVLVVLPYERRISEARRILALSAVRDDEELVLHYTAYLGWSEAEPVLTAASRRNAAEQRADGYELLIACAARTRDPAIVSTVVGGLTRLRNEQDPVRARALQALARIPPWLLEPAVADALDRLVTDAVQARDSSATTLHALGLIAIDVLRRHADSPELLGFAQRTLDRIYRGNRLPYLGRLDIQLRHGQEAQFYAAVRPWLEAGVRRGEYEPVFALTRALRRRAWGMPELQALLERGIGRRNVAMASREAIGLWLADPANRADRVERVLREDESAAVLPTPWSVLCGRRTDLLDRVLTGRPLSGRFVARGVSWVPVGVPPVRRWLPRQQEAYVRLLSQLAADASTGVHVRASAIATAARVPGYGTALVHRYLDSPDVNLSEAALAAVAWSHPPADALRLLLSHVDSDRARVATYAAGRVARRVAPSQAIEALRAALESRKITSRKEALRILGRLAVPGAGAVLTAVWQRPEQHRDVRAAVVSAARQRLDDPLTWPILTEAVGAERTATLMVLDADPFAIAESRRRPYAELILRACRSTDAEVSRQAWRAFPAWTQWLDDPRSAVVGRLTDLTDRVVWSRVVPALVSLVADGSGQAVTVDALIRLIELDRTSAEAEDRDRPAYRRITGIVAALTAWSSRAAADADRTPLTIAGGRLAGEPELLPLALRLLVHGLDLDTPQGTLAGLTVIADLTRDRPLATQVAAEALRGRLAEHTDPAEPALAAAHSMAGRDDAAGGLLAVALASVGERYGWSVPWRQLVLALRRHSAVDVRTAALALVLAPE